MEKAKAVWAAAGVVEAGLGAAPEAVWGAQAAVQAARAA